jgi:DNA-binding transcriptional MerR regulator
VKQPPERQPSGGLAAFDDADAPLFSVGQAAEVLGTHPATLRRLDAAGVVSPGRSSGGQRRYSRHQIERAARIQAYVTGGTSVVLAGYIVDLEDELRLARQKLRKAQHDRRPAR